MAENTNKPKQELNATQLNVLQQFSKKMFQNEHPPVKHIYVDLEAFVDFYLGAIMLMIKTNVEYQYVVSRLEAYAKYPYRDITKVFPSLKFSMEDIEKLISDEKIAPLILNSPTKSLFYDWVEMAAEWSQKNKVQDNNIIPIVHVNCRTMKLTDAVKQKWTMYFQDTVLNCNVRFYHNAYSDFTVEFVNQMDVMVIDDCEAFFDNPKLKDDIEAGNYIGKEVYGFRYLGKDISIAEDELEQTFDQTEAALCLFFGFRYLDKRVLMTQQKKGPN